MILKELKSEYVNICLRIEFDEIDISKYDVYSKYGICYVERWSLGRRVEGGICLEWIRVGIMDYGSS